MRISCDPNDPGYIEWNSVGRLNARVFLNGTEIRDVITADEEAGMLVHYVRGESGNLLIRNGVVIRKTLYGKVELH